MVSHRSLRAPSSAALAVMLAATTAAHAAPIFRLTPTLPDRTVVLADGGNVAVVARAHGNALDRFDLAGGITAYNTEVRSEIVQDPGGPQFEHVAVSADGNVVIHTGSPATGPQYFVVRKGTAPPYVVHAGGGIVSLAINRAGSFAFAKVDMGSGTFRLVRVALTFPHPIVEICSVNAPNVLVDLGVSAAPDRWMSDDGSRAVYRDGDGAVTIATLTASGAVRTVFGGPGFILSAAMSGDGARIAVTGWGSLGVGGCTGAGYAVSRLDVTYDGSGAATITNCTTLDSTATAEFYGSPAMSGDGNVVYWTSNGTWSGQSAVGYDLWVNAGPGTTSRVTALTSPVTGAVHPRVGDAEGRRVGFILDQAGIGAPTLACLASPLDTPATPAPLLAGEDPDSPFDLTASYTIVGPAQYRGTLRLRDDAGLGPLGTYLAWHGRGGAGLEPDFSLGWSVQQAIPGQPGALMLTSPVLDASGGYDTYVARAIGQGVQLDVRESEVP